MTVAIWQKLAEYSNTTPDKDWLISPETDIRVSWSDALARSDEVAAILAGANIRRGASVAIASANSINAALIMMGITSAGYMATPLNLVAGARVMPYVL